jgi:hypothetical protein
MLHKMACLHIKLKQEREQIVDLNRDHRVHLTGTLMWGKIGDYSDEFDRYASELFERPVRGSWRIFLHMAKTGVPYELDWPKGGNPWTWDTITERPHYPADEVMTFEFFASVYLHEVAHGWFYLLTDVELLERLSIAGQWESQPKTNWRRDEEEICWEVSRFVCKLLDIPFDEEAIPDDCPQYKSPTT